MSLGTLQEFSGITDGRLVGEDRSFIDISTDSRRFAAGQLYIALRGPNFDGHDFVADVAAHGAVGAVVEHEVDAPIAQVVVDDTRRALGAFAGAWRQRFDVDTVAITGSNGKTSVKEMTAAILQRRGDTLATRGNYNNDIGVPLTLLRLNRQHRCAVVEVGASGPNEVGPLASLAKPDVALVNNAGPAHLEGFGSVEGVANAKGEIYSALDENGTAVINAGDRFAPLWREMAGQRRRIEFAENGEADFSFSDFSQSVEGGSASISFTMHTPAGDAPVMVPVAGRHNALNALAASAACFALGVSLQDIVAGLADAGSASGRLQVHAARGGACVINDSYNANPGSTRAAIDFLAEQAEPGWLVLGDMLELGDDAARMHAQIGKHARDQGIEKLYATGELSRSAAVAFGEGGRWFESRLDLIDALNDDLRAGVNILVKASRSMRLEKVVEAIKAPAVGASKDA